MLEYYADHVIVDYLNWRNKMIYAFSSGGTGDALIILSKLKVLSEIHNQKILWSHFERHICHQDPFNQIMKSAFASTILHANSSFIPIAPPEKAENIAKDKAAKVGGRYINTNVRDPLNIMDPHIPAIGDVFNYSKPFVCVQIAAGRMEDATRRILTPTAVKNIQKKLPDFPIIAVGPISLTMPGVVYIKTPNILQAFGIIDQCSAFVGQDGVLAYYAMMQKKPTVINFHDPILPQHYYHPSWVPHSFVLKGSQMVVDLGWEALEFLVNKIRK